MAPDVVIRYRSTTHLARATRHIPKEHYQHSTIPAPASTAAKISGDLNIHVRSGSTQDLMPLSPREKRQDSREEQRAYEQDRNAYSCRMAVKFAVLIFEQVVEQVDRHDEKCDYHESDERAGAEVDAVLGVVDFFAGAGLQGVFLSNT
jgi:hypothetical protein